MVPSKPVCGVLIVTLLRVSGGRGIVYHYPHSIPSLYSRPTELNIHSQIIESKVISFDFRRVP